MSLTIDREKCIGCGTCTALCSGVFKMDEEGKATIADENGDDQENIKTAADSCPVQAISIE